MREYTFSEARQKLASLLDRARRDGSVRIRRRDGQLFVLKAERGGGSPFDVPGLDLKLQRDEIVNTVKESRRKVKSDRRRSGSRPRPKQA